MVHVFCPINDKTITSNYPIKRAEPILNTLSMPRFGVYWYETELTGTEQHLQNKVVRFLHRDPLPAFSAFSALSELNVA